MVVPPAEVSRIGSPPVGPPRIHPSLMLEICESAQMELCSMRCISSSGKKQQDRTTSRDLTTTTRLSMLGASSARGDMVYPGRLAD